MSSAKGLLVVFLMVIFSAASANIDITNEILVFDPSQSVFVPLHTQSRETTDKATVVIRKAWINQYIKPICNSPYWVYVNHQLVQKAEPGQSIFLDQVYFGEKESFCLTIHSSKPLKKVYLHPKKEFTGYTNEITNKTNLPQDFAEIKHAYKVFQNRYIIGFAAVVLLLVVLKTLMQNFFGRFVQIALETIPKEREAEKKKIWSTENIITYTVGIALLLILFFVFEDKLRVQYLEAKNKFSVVFGIFLVFLFIFIVIKIIVHQIFQPFYNIRNYSKYTIYNLIVIFILLVLTITPYYFITLSPYKILEINPDIRLEVLLVGAFAIWFVKGIIDYVRFFGFYKMYLITYICISDLFPFLVLLKVSKELIS